MSKMLLGLFVLVCALALAGSSIACQRGPYGGQSGKSFTDYFSAKGPITRIDLRFGRRIDGIQVTYGDVKGKYHGGRPGHGRRSSFFLDHGAYIVEVQGRIGRKIDRLRFIDNNGKAYGDLIGTGGNHFVAKGSRLLFIAGKASWGLDQLTFFFENCH